MEDARSLYSLTEILPPAYLCRDGLPHTDVSLTQHAQCAVP
jgi:hypothetical protein